MLQRYSYQLFRFAVVGTLGFFVDAALLHLLYPYGGFYWSRAFSFLAAVMVTWLGNRMWTFRTRSVSMPLMKEGTYYLALMLLGGCANYIVYVACIRYSTYMTTYPSLAVAIGSLSGLLINWVSTRYFIYE